ncbi:hypothetical protein [Neoroseomonas oryzicola]|uniref:Uncharacterized protein n=1 Tax=Neoroseomonas oryzicola TaxID=535904 RepID=A0A9X9WL66_9PROT|nr:hypothetical protein [Neoroseomonas oryzicola]MBR0661076.1 hypothetical protein [Neoroseomonas oryzicola]NKE18275.1 hypothetical protein [Neoroseomonas oryzicola]
MPAVKRAKTSFAAGELAPELLGRGDLRAFENGARRLRNVFIQPTGGVTRRPGLRHVTPLPGPARLIAFEFNTEQTYLMVLTAGTLQVFQGDAAVASLAGPWTTAMLPQIGFTQSADTLLLTHPDMAPQRVTRTTAGWTIAAWSFVAEPFFRFADPAMTLQATGTSGTVTLFTSATFFQPGHVGARLRIAGRRLLVTALQTAQQASAVVEDALAVTGPTTDWDEAAFSGARGWPVSCGFHQERLVVGGSRDLPNRLWLSRTGDLFNFDAGTGLDDEAIEFGLVSDQVNAIRGVFSGRHLQVFTSGAEWMVTGDPLTPASIQLNRQTRVGSPVDRLMPPVDVDGSTVFVARSGQGVYEFAYTDVSQTYQANDLAILARHIVSAPVSVAYDQGARLLHLVMADGSIGTLTIYRAEQVTAWTRQETDGAFRAVAESEGIVWAVTERDGAFALERFDAALGLDAALTGTAPTPQDQWSGLGHLEGRVVGVLADGAPRAAASVLDGAVTLEDAASSVQVGLVYRHEIEPLPPDLISAAGAATGPLRLVAVTFRLLGTPALAVDLGRGAEPLSFRRLDTPVLDVAPAPFTGDVTLRGLGWRRDRLRPLWRIEGEVPLPMTLLSVTTEIRMTD